MEEQQFVELTDEQLVDVYGGGMIVWVDNTLQGSFSLADYKRWLSLRDGGTPRGY